MRGFQRRGRGNTPSRRIVQAGMTSLALAMATVAWPGQASAPFTVRVDLTTSGTCSSGPESPAQPSTVLVQCQSRPIASSEPSLTARSGGQAFRFHIPSSSGESRYGAVDLYAGAGTITSWRIVHLTDWDYLEMTVGW